jgi:hypothetical protein
MKCDDEPITTYVRVNNANVEIRGCQEHLKVLLECYNKGREVLYSFPDSVDKAQADKIWKQATGEGE